MKLWKPWHLRGRHDRGQLTARRANPIWWPDGLDWSDTADDMRRRLFRRNYPRADMRGMRHQLRPYWTKQR